MNSKPLRRYDPVRLSSGSAGSGRSRTRSKNRDRDRDAGRSSPAIHRHSLIRKSSNGSQEVSNWLITKTTNSCFSSDVFCSLLSLNEYSFVIIL